MRAIPIAPAALVLALGLLACGVDPVLECEPVGGARPVCGMQSPEDLAVLPGGRTLLVSQYGAMDGHRPGSLASFELDGDRLEVLYAGGGEGPAPGWGDADCPGPPASDFSPHGLDLAQRPDGALQLLVVNHGGRESIEFFEVATDPVALRWRGCAIAPEATLLNDVAALPDGALLATNMYPNHPGFWGVWAQLRAGVLGTPSGHVLEWRAGRGFAKLAGTDEAIPNGIAVSADGSTLYLNSSANGTVRRIARVTGRELGRAEIQSPDNVSWGEGGRLLVASLRGSLPELLDCFDLEEGACPIAFAIVALDPVTMQTEELYANEGAPMGAGTSAVEVDGELFIGSFSGDRLLRVAPAG